MSPRTPQKFQEMREEKKALIMDVALLHFANEGYFNTTIRHIARHAGISKGLMYNYFDSKEALLTAIVHRSVNEIFNYFDIDRDGYLSVDEFEYFIRKINVILKEKRSFWRLLIQLLTQNEAREQFMKLYQVSDSVIHPGHEPGDNQYPAVMMKMIRDYFFKKKEKAGDNYDPGFEYNMFMLTLKGFAITRIYADDIDDDHIEKIINRIIGLFK
jgi:AcrR family transcriptional regulator